MKMSFREKIKEIPFPKPPEELAKGWKDIARYTPYTMSTLTHNYKDEIYREGVIFKASIGSCKRITTCGFIWKIQRFFSLKGQAGELYGYKGKEQSL